MTRMTGADAIIRSLEAEGVDVCFGVPGGMIIDTYDALYRAIANGSKLRHVLARHEQGAGHMAEGYARASGRVGVAIATSGPGTTNLVTPIADAWMDSTPLVCVTGQVPSAKIGTDAFQETNATGITLPIVKHSWLVQKANEIPATIKAAFHVAQTGRYGPVLVDITKDAQIAELDFKYPDHVDLPGWNPPRKVNHRQIAAAAKAILEADKPVFYVGGGIINGEATAELLELAEFTKIPVVTTLTGKGGFPDSHPLHAGHPGMHGMKYSNLALNRADLVIAVGTRFDDRVTGNVSAFAPNAKVIHFEVDAAEIGKIREAQIPICAPLKPALAQLSAELRKQIPDGREGDTDWLNRIAEWKDEFPLRYERGDKIKPQEVLEAVRDATEGRDDIVWTTGVGQHQMWAMQYLNCNQPRTFISSGGLGTMGYGVPAAVGAKAARLDATVICVDGDGCFQMTSKELTTAVLHNLPIIVVLIRNGYLGMVRQWQEMFYGERYSQTDLTGPIPDYSKMAEAFGALPISVTGSDEIAPALEQAITENAAGRTVVVNVLCSEDEKVFPMIPAGASAADIIEYGSHEKAKEVEAR
ncbi:MAG: biosynthetic-type acetolactate synthase large subunit [Gaiellaceae bacterium]